MPEDEITFTVYPSPQGGYEARAVGESIFTEAESLEQVRAMVRDAVRCHFEEDGRPATARLRLITEEVINI